VARWPRVQRDERRNPYGIGVPARVTGMRPYLTLERGARCSPPQCRFPSQHFPAVHPGMSRPPHRPQPSRGI